MILSGRLRDGAAGAAAVAAVGGTVLVQDPADADSPDMPLAALDQVPDAAVWPAAKLGSAISDLVDDATPTLEEGPVTARRSWGPEDVDAIDGALWVAVSQLQAHADAQRRLLQRLEPGTSVAADSRARAERALHAAEVITERVLPIFQLDATSR